MYAQWKVVSSIVIPDDTVAGDIILADETIVSGASFAYDSGETSYSKLIAVGLKSSSTTLQWAPEGTTGQTTCFTKIIGSFSDQSLSSSSSGSGDTDGSDNWAEIQVVDSTGTTNAATNYPLFNFANTYEASGISSGWYIPSAAELVEVWKQMSIINTRLATINSANSSLSDSTLKGYYHTSSQSGTAIYALGIVFSNSNAYTVTKIQTDIYGLVIRQY